MWVKRFSCAKNSCGCENSVWNPGRENVGAINKSGTTASFYVENIPDELSVSSVNSFCSAFQFFLRVHPSNFVPGNAGFLPKCVENTKFRIESFYTTENGFGVQKLSPRTFPRFRKFRLSAWTLLRPHKATLLAWKAVNLPILLFMIQFDITVTGIWNQNNLCTQCWFWLNKVSSSLFLCVLNLLCTLKLTAAWTLTIGMVGPFFVFLPRLKLR